MYASKQWVEQKKRRGDIEHRLLCQDAWPTWEGNIKEELRGMLRKCFLIFFLGRGSNMCECRNERVSREKERFIKHGNS